jgi:hypothetical protein
VADTAQTLAKTMPSATLRGLDGQTHDVDPAALAPALIQFFGRDEGGQDRAGRDRAGLDQAGCQDQADASLTRGTSIV